MASASTPTCELAIYAVSAPACGSQNPRARAVDLAAGAAVREDPASTAGAAVGGFCFAAAAAFDE